MSTEHTTEFKLGNGEDHRHLLSEINTGVPYDTLKLSLLAHLNDINAADPMQYRRKAVEHIEYFPRTSIAPDELKEIARLQDVLAEPVFSSHRRFLGPFIVMYKKVMFRFFRKWLQVSLSKQFELNQRLLNLAISVNLLENKVHSLEKSIQDRK